MRISFFPDNFIEGTKDFTDTEVGVYMRALCFQAKHKVISEPHLIKLCGGIIDKKIRSKFKTDENGNLYNERMRKEVIDAIRMEARDEMIKKELHLFENSEMHNKHIFKSCFPSWSKEKLLHYYERADEWSMNKDGRSKDWAKTISSWAKQDELKGIKFKTNRIESKVVYGN